MEDKNNGAIMAFGGVMTVVILGMWAMRFIERMLIQLGHTFDAFSKMVTSTLGVLLALSQMALLVSIIGGSVVAAIYFTYKYYRMVRRATELQEGVASQLREFRGEIGSHVHQLEREVQDRLNGMALTLRKALEEPKATPTNETPQLAPPETQTSISNAASIPEAREVTEVPQNTEPRQEPVDLSSSL